MNLNTLFKSIPIRGIGKKVLLMIKLTTLIMITALTQLSAAVYSQKITLDGNNMPIEKVLKAIKTQSGYQLFYTKQALEKTSKISVSLKNVSVEDALLQVLKDQPVEYSVIEKTIVVKERPLSLFRRIANALSRPGPILVIGKVVNQHQQPMPGVSVRVKGGSGVITDAKGEFTIFVALEDGVVQFSYIGYITQEVPVKGLSNPLTVILKEDISKLDEVQVIAYGTTSKRLNTGDQTTITSKQIETYPVGNVLSVLQGTVPGMTVSQASGQPGGSFSVNIRGRNGIRTGADPFYVIDGVPYQGGNYFTQKNNLSEDQNRGYDALSFINPLDIESINVLKDADATAIYGARAANGVILITTKKGKAGRTKVDLSVSSGISKVTRLPEMLNTQQYLQMRKEALKNDNLLVGAADYDINGTWDTTRYTNWAKELIGGTGHTTNAQASVSGGNMNTQYLISGNFRKQTNIQSYAGGADQIASMHFNLNNTSADGKFSIVFTGGYSYTLNTVPNVDRVGNITLAPDAPALFNQDGTINFENGTFSNPTVTNNQLANATATNLMSSMVLSYKVLKGLELKATLGYNKQQLNEFLGVPISSTQPSLNIKSGVSRFTTDNAVSWSIEPQAVYTTQLGKGQLNAIVGSSLQKQISETTALLVTGYNSDLLLRSITAGTAISPASPYDYQIYKFNAVFGRLNYNLSGKYLLNITGRYDGSSKFGEDRQFHLFGSAGAAWIFSEEKFIKEALPFLSFGKLRASYGVTGNDQIGNNLYLENYAVSTNPYQGIPGLYPNNLPNANLSWESTRKAEAGIELQFLKGRIGLEASYFNNRSSDILSASVLPMITGFPQISDNIDAVVTNKGTELVLNTINIQHQAFSWNTTFLFTRQRNKLASIPNATAAQQMTIGESVGVKRVYNFAGVNTQTGLYQFYDKNGNITNNPILGVDDTKKINLTPDYFGSVQNSFVYKNFTLDFLFRFIKQVGLSAFGQSSPLPPGFGIGNNTPDVLARWQKPGDITNIERYSGGFTGYQPYANAKNSDFAYADASYIRFQNVAFGYRFPEAALRKLHLHGLRVYLQGENLLTISKYGNLDPENRSLLRMPPIRIFTTGLQLTL